MAETDDRLRGIASAFYLLLLSLGIFFYLGWGLVYNSWDITKAENMGVYAITVLCVGFGATGFLLYRAPSPKSEKSEK